MPLSSRARPRAVDFHAHVIVPEVYALAAQHNIFSELPTDPGVTDDMRKSIKARAATVLARMSDLTDRIVNMDAMGVDVQVLSASLVHQGLEWADAQTSLRRARTTNDWIAKAVAAHPARLVGLGTLPLHVPALAVAELERCARELRLKGAAISTTAGTMELGDPQLRPFWAKAEELGAVIYIHPGGNRDRRLAGAARLGLPRGRSKAGRIRHRYRHAVAGAARGNRGNQRGGAARLGKSVAAPRRGRLATQHGCWLCSALSGPKVPQHGRRDDGRTAAQSHFHL